MQAIHSIDRRRLLGTLAAFAAAGSIDRQAMAQTGATPLRVIIPAGAGSGQDAIVRAGQNALATALRRPVVVENLTGSGGIIGTTQLVRAAPDGNTISFVSNNHVVNPSVYKTIPYDTLKDITPITILGETPLLLVVNPKRIPAKNAKEMVALIKSHPDQFNFGSSGNGTILHLAAEMFNEAAGIKARHIPYRGVGPMTADLLGGQVDYGVLAVSAAQPHLKAGTLRAIGVMGAQPVGSLPDLQTLKQQGLNLEVGGWLAAVGPAKLPASEVKRLHDAIVVAWETPEVKKAMAEQENIIDPTSPEAAAGFFRSELARYAELVKKANVSVD